MYNTSLYLLQKNNLFNNYLNYTAGVANEIKNSQTLLDCVHQSSGFITLSGYSPKPVLNIESEATTEATTGEIKDREVGAKKFIIFITKTT